MRIKRKTDSELTDTRRLAAVMFADIEGYTTLFQRHESAAILQVEDHRLDLEKLASSHRGEIIQFFGDGSVTVFDSVIDALHCAIALQQISVLHRIPIRIGIHIGDLVYKNGDIFGDVVNITSRIQALGLPGSVLITRKVVDELTSHPEFKTTRLGLFSLKNVASKLEIFALAGQGLTVPEIQKRDPVVPANRKILVWLGVFFLVVFAAYIFRSNLLSAGPKLAEARIILPPFTNYTADAEFTTLGDIASSYITNALNRTVTANVISYESMLRHTNVDLASIIQFPNKARRMGADVVILGNYTLAGTQKDSLLFWLSVLDLREPHLAPVSLSDVRCDASDPMVCLEALVDNLKGYWRSKGENLFRKTNGKAYAAYHQAQKIWADPDLKQQAKAHLREAIQFDPKFLNAYFLLLDAFNNDGEYVRQADTIALIRSRFDDLNAREENFLHYYEADLYGRNEQAFQYFLQEYAHDSSDLFMITTGMVMAMEYLNDPQTTLKFYSKLDADSLDLNVCTYCHTTLNMALEAYLSLSNMDRAGRLAERLLPNVKRPAQFTSLMHYYIRQGDTARVSSIIRRGVQEGRYWDDASYYNLLAARLATIQGRTDLTRYYARRALSLYEVKNNRTAARCYALLGELENARNIYVQELTRRPENKALVGELGVIYAREGNSTKAEEMIIRLSDMKATFDFGETPYLQGRIKANLGDPDAALRYLQQALDEGIGFRVITTFQQDPDLIILNKEPAYIALVGSKRQR